VYRSSSRISVGITRTTRFKGLSLVDKMTKSFLYFAYGSNLLARRLHINNPSAVRKEIGKLKASSRIQKTFSDTNKVILDYHIVNSVELKWISSNYMNCMLKSTF
jgi:hypothetical protein